MGLTLQFRLRSTDRQSLWSGEGRPPPLSNDTSASAASATSMTVKKLATLSNVAGTDLLPKPMTCWELRKQESGGRNGGGSGRGERRLRHLASRREDWRRPALSPLSSPLGGTGTSTPTSTNQVKKLRLLQSLRCQAGCVPPPIVVEGSSHGLRLSHQLLVPRHAPRPNC